jgi:2-polyprenyl-3-methyl-5-hydroxy-6-metoxy-1,4-benzoquinol methylase
MVTYCKVLEKRDYGWLPTNHILSIRDRLVDAKAMARFEHEHRAWEYGIVMQALLDKNCKNVADVGGGASVFAPAYILAGKHSVFQIDPGIEMHWLPDQSKALEIDLHYAATSLDEYVAVQKEHSLAKFDAVVSISTIEHVVNDKHFFNNLLKMVAPQGLLAITFDYHPSGKQLVQGHLRTYNAKTIKELAADAVRKGFAVFGYGMDYTWRGPEVYDYNFGSLIMERRYA